MTSDEPRAELREKVVKALCDTEWGDGHWESDALSQTERTSYEILADAAIAIALEEAAKIVSASRRKKAAVSAIRAMLKD